MVTTTTVYSFQKPAVAGDEDQWGTYLNNNIDKYESILTGNTTITSLVITTADINGGTLDNVVIGGTTAAAVTGTTITGTSFVSSGDMTFGDNDKAIFGAGSDLQIYHDGSNNRLNVTSGNLYVNLPDTSEFTVTGTQNTAFKVDVDSAVTLYNNGSPKLTTTSTGIDVTGTVTATGGAFTGNVTFGDSDEARFGAGSDLRIYHNGSNSIIWDEGVGNLQLVSSGASVDIIKAGGENMATFATDGAVTLYYDNAAKLATTSTGVDVTGTVTADQLTVYNGTSDPDVLFRNNGTGDVTLTFRRGAADDVYTDWSLVNDSGTFKFISDNSSDPDHTQLTMSQGDISFYEDTGTTAKFFWDASAEALALGTATSVSNNRLVIDQASGDGQNSGFYMQRNGGTGTSFKLDIDGNDVANFRRSSTTALAIDNSANVGIGTTPSTELHVAASSGYAELRLQGASGSSGSLEFYDSTTKRGDIFIDTSSNILFRNTSEAMRIDSSGNVGVGTSSPNSYSGYTTVTLNGGTNGSVFDFERSGTIEGEIVATANAFGVGAVAASGVLTFRSGGNTERMRIDSSGRVGIGTSSPDATGLHVHTGSAGTLTPNSAADDLVVESNGNSGITIASPDASYSRIIFSSPSDVTGSLIEYNKSGATLDVGTATSGGVLRFRSGNYTERMRISSGGVVAIGNSSPKTWSGNSQGVLQIGNTGAIELYNTTDDPFAILSNLYRGTDLNYKYIENNEAARISFYEGNIFFATAPTGTADTTATVTTRLKIENGGNVGIGTDSPSAKLEVNGGTDNEPIKVVSTDAGSYVSVADNGTTGSTRFGAVSNDFKIDVNSSERLRIDSSGNVGIGTTSPTSKFQVDDSNNSRLSFAESGVGNSYVTIRAGANTKNSVVTFSNATDSTTGSIDYDHAVDALDFFTNGANRRMRLTNDGNVLIGKTVIDNTTAGHRFTNSGFMSVVRNGATAAFFNRLTSDGTLVSFLRSSTTVGSISVTSSATAYNTSSDRRLKENIDDADDAGSLIDAIQVRKFDWKVDGSHQRYGMIAQELNDIVPEAVSIPEDEEEMQSVDYSKLVPMLVKEIQSLRNRITELEAN